MHSNRIIRPPFEKRSINLKVTSGCSHNNCKFCNYYRTTIFNVSSYEEITEDLKKLKEEKVSYKRVWLLSADAFSLDYDKLYNIGTLIQKHLPYISSIGCYARVDSLQNKSTSQLKKLKKIGYDSIVFGIESCDDYILEYMNKGYTSKEVLRQLKKMDNSGMKYTVIFLNGLCGHSYGLNHAIKTAQLFNKLKPERIMINRLIIHKDTHFIVKLKIRSFLVPIERNV